MELKMNDLMQYFLGAIVEKREYPDILAKISEYKINTQGVFVGLTYQLYSSENHVDEIISLQELMNNWVVFNESIINIHDLERNPFSGMSYLDDVSFSKDSEIISSYLSGFCYDPQKREAILAKYQKLQDEFSFKRTLN